MSVVTVLEYEPKLQSMFHKRLFGLDDLGNYPYYIFLEFCASVLF